MTAISKNGYFDVLKDIVNKYNNTVHKTIKKTLLMLQMILLLNTMKNQIKKILNLKLVIVLEFLSTKMFLLKDMLLIGQKKRLLLIKLKIEFLRLMLLMI